MKAGIRQQCLYAPSKLPELNLQSSRRYTLRVTITPGLPSPRHGVYLQDRYIATLSLDYACLPNTIVACIFIVYKPDLHHQLSIFTLTAHMNTPFPFNFFQSPYSSLPIIITTNCIHLHRSPPAPPLTMHISTPTLISPLTTSTTAQSRYRRNECGFGETALPFGRCQTTGRYCPAPGKAQADMLCIEAGYGSAVRNRNVSLLFRPRFSCFAFLSVFWLGRETWFGLVWLVWLGKSLIKIVRRIRFVALLWAEGDVEW